MLLNDCEMVGEQVQNVSLVNWLLPKVTEVLRI
jgi:hypothetical protein